MTLSEFYAAIGSDVEQVLRRIPSEKMLTKFVRMYAQDESFAQLESALKASDWGNAFRAAHTLKGVAQNLGFDRMQQAASDLTEALRGGRSLQQPELMEKVQSAQAEIEKVLHQLQ